MKRKTLSTTSPLTRWLSCFRNNSPAKFALGVVLLLVFILPLVTAVYANTTISQSYTADSTLPPGSMVSLVDNSSDHVEPTTVNNVDNLLGVAINADDSLIKLTGSQDNQVQVATGGTLDVLVSDINGDIARGDHITASPIAMIGMKATRNSKVVGIAQADLTPERGRSETYTDEDGREQTVLLGEVPVLINVAYYFATQEKTIIPAAIQNISNAVAGKPIEPLPIIISGVIFIVTMVAVASIIFSMIRGSIISVGRNPMSQSAVYRNVMQLTALVLGILSVAVASIYLVLTRL